MIVHQDVLWGVPPWGGPSIKIHGHIRADVLEAERKRRAREGWGSLEIRPCLPCAERRELVSA